MATIARLISIDPQRVALALQQAAERLVSTEGETVVDFSSVERIDPAGLRALEQLSRIADEKSIKVVLSGVNVEVYKVLKLVKLTRAFSFVN